MEEDERGDAPAVRCANLHRHTQSGGTCWITSVRTLILQFPSLVKVLYDERNERDETLEEVRLILKLSTPDFKKRRRRRAIQGARDRKRAQFHVCHTKVQTKPRRVRRFWRAGAAEQGGGWGSVPPVLVRHDTRPGRLILECRGNHQAPRVQLDTGIPRARRRTLCSGGPSARPCLRQVLSLGLE